MVRSKHRPLLSLNSLELLAVPYVIDADPWQHKGWQAIAKPTARPAKAHPHPCFMPAIFHPRGQQWINFILIAGIKITCNNERILLFRQPIEKLPEDVI